MSTPAAATSIRHEIVVEAPIARAFSVFTDGFGSFKPPEHNILGVERAETVFEPRVGGDVYDRGIDGSTRRWARVLAYEPPHPVVIGWDINPQWHGKRVRRPGPASSSSIATSIATATAGRPSAKASTARLDGRYTCTGSPTCWRGELMAPLGSTIEIARPQDEVFCYVTDPATSPNRSRAWCARSVEPRGHVILATFGPGGPTRCSGLPAARYGADELAAIFADRAELVSAQLEEHRTPSGVSQQFLFAHLTVRASDF